MSLASATAPHKKAIILTGPPGSGKGTLAGYLNSQYRCAHFATGDLLRQCIQAQSDVGKKVADIMKSGSLVSDSIVFEVLKEALGKAGETTPNILFDGFPRTVEQCKDLTKLLESMKIDLAGVVVFDCPDNVVVERICGRRIHTKSGRSYHVIFNPPKVPEKDDVTGEPLDQRPDDNKDSVVKRLQHFREETGPVVDFYEKTLPKSQIVHIDGSKSIDQIRTMTSAIPFIASL